MHPPLTALECWSLGPSLQATARSSSCVIFGLSSSCRCSALHTTQEPSHVQSVVSCEDFCFFGTRNHPAIGSLALQARRALSKDDKRVIRTSARGCALLIWAETAIRVSSVLSKCLSASVGSGSHARSMKQLQCYIMRDVAYSIIHPHDQRGKHRH